MSATGLGSPPGLATNREGIQHGSPVPLPPLPIEYAGAEMDSAYPGAIGFDWVTVSNGRVSWLISGPRKKLIKQQLPTLATTQWPPSNLGVRDCGSPADGVQKSLVNTGWLRVTALYPRGETMLRAGRGRPGLLSPPR
jgi:hypothetical protein